MSERRIQAISETLSSAITIAGTGTVGGYVGGCLAAAGRRVTLFGRQALMETIENAGLRVSDPDGFDATILPGQVTTTTDPRAAFQNADIILVTVKSAQTKEMGQLIAAHAGSVPIVVSYQNGVGNAAVLDTQIGQRGRTVAGMVPFNVIQTRDENGVPHFHRATSGRITIAAGTPGLAEQLTTQSAPIIEHNDMTAVSWGKLIINLNNALNALSGLTLREELADRRWRLILAAQATEALTALKTSGITPARVGGVVPKLMPFGLRLPNSIYPYTAGAALAIDPKARSSLWEDLEKRRPTEVASLQGAVMDLAAKAGTPAPMVTRVEQLIRVAEAAGAGSPCLPPEEVAGGLIKLK